MNGQLRRAQLSIYSQTRFSVNRKRLLQTPVGFGRCAVKSLDFEPFQYGCRICRRLRKRTQRSPIERFTSQPPNVIAIGRLFISLYNPLYTVDLTGLTDLSSFGHVEISVEGHVFGSRVSLSACTDAATPQRNGHRPSNWRHNRDTRQCQCPAVTKAPDSLDYKITSLCISSQNRSAVSL